MRRDAVIKAVSIELPVQLHLDVKAKAAQQGRTLQHLYRDLLEQFLNEPKESPQRWGDRPEHRDAHELLDYILTNGAPEQIEWIIGNLRTFGDAIRAKPVRRKKNAAGD